MPPGWSAVTGSPKRWPQPSERRGSRRPIQPHAIRPIAPCEPAAVFRMLQMCERLADGEAELVRVAGAGEEEGHDLCRAARLATSRLDLDEPLLVECAELIEAGVKPMEGQVMRRQHQARRRHGLAQ